MESKFIAGLGERELGPKSAKRIHYEAFWSEIQHKIWIKYSLSKVVTGTWIKNKTGCHENVNKIPVLINLEKTTLWKSILKEELPRKALYNVVINYTWAKLQKDMK